MIHELKTAQPHFGDIVSGKKTFEIRKADRNYKVGDTLLLKEWIPMKGYTKQQKEMEVLHILQHAPHFGLKNGFVIMSIR